ncbi:MAG: hypothetical protein EG828_12810 [Deltaproteobacteria bacterium]|nr:hypothetical protein [Deltaproteobacteria bacterium]
MKEWANRPPEIAALLNPAFCGLLLSIGLGEYTKNFSDGAPYAFPFVMLPLVLHKPTRQMFPRSSRTAFSAWITNSDTAIVKIGFAERAKNMAPYVKESLAFAMQNNRVYVTESGRLKATNPVPKSFPNATQEVNECVRASVMCGKWFSMVGDFKTAMALLGVKP